MCLSSARRTLWLPGLALFGFLLAARGPGQENAPVPGGNLVTSLNADPSSFNRMMGAPSLANALLSELISSDLVHINHATFELEPALAESWSLDPDGRTYTIHLRKGITYPDGTPFTAEDVIFSMRVLESPESMLGDQVKIDGAFPSTIKIDDYTVRMRFPRMVGMGLRCLDSVPMLPSRKLVGIFESGKMATAWGPASRPQDIAGLGPFRLKQYSRGDRVILERNPKYWKRDRSGRPLPYLDSITFLIIPDRNSEALRFQSGELDVLNALNPENYAMLRRRQTEMDVTVRDLGPGLVMDFLWFNLNPGKSASGNTYLDAEKRALFDQPLFRQAVSTALDREGMVRSILLGLGTPQFGPISSGNKTWYQAPVSTPAFDGSRARVLLAKCGLSDGDRDGILEYGVRRRPLEVELLTARGSLVREKMIEVIKENLAAIGIRVVPQTILPNELISRLLESFNYDAILFGFTPTDIVPDLQTDFWLTSGKNHFWHPGQRRALRPWEAEIDGQIEQLIRTLNPEIRRRHFARVQEIWAQYLPAIPTIAANVLTGWNNRVGNLRPSILAPHLLWNAEELTKKGGQTARP